MDQDVSKKEDSLVSESRHDSSCGGARYKLMSPAKLPISRSTCITIPPGLSPTSFLESPVLLSNIKAEHSPTTGSLFKPHAVHASSSSFTARTIHQSLLDEKKSSDSFEFRPPAYTMFYAELDKHRSEHSPTEAATSLSRQTDVPHRTTLSVPETSDQDEPVQTFVNDSKGSAPLILADDGYNWRKYGQKHVKGSEFPRSYYKCTHPNCEVKKLFERSHYGQITEIVYKGTHDHPKPQPSRRNSGGLVMHAQEERLDMSSSFNEQNGSDDVGELTMSNRNNDDVDDNDPKRRKVDGTMEITPPVKPIREPRVVVQTLSEVDILDDGFRWRKYGQKVVRGNPNPRSYYKCTAAGCPVRKHVERASHDPKAVITTYEGKHNHDIPTARSNNNNNDLSAPRFRPEETTDRVSLNLGVGCSNEHPHQQEQNIRYEFVHQTQRDGAGGFRFVHGPAMGSSYYANSLNPSINHQI